MDLILPARLYISQLLSRELRSLPKSPSGLFDDPILKTERPLAPYVDLRDQRPLGPEGVHPQDVQGKNYKVERDRFYPATDGPYRSDGFQCAFRV
jgi:hypothetical protein